MTLGIGVAAAASALLLATLQPAVAATPASTVSPSIARGTGLVARTVNPHNKPAHYVVSSFNVLGASHTKHSKKWAPGSKRIVWVRRLLIRHKVDVAGFQEMQVSQLLKFKKITKGHWHFYPGRKLGHLDSENSIGWRKDKFSLVDASTVTIPYFNGHGRKMPVVLLRNKKSQMLTYFSNFHNPAETSEYHHQEKWRKKATKIEIALQNQLVESGIPRVMTGDMNERGPYFCRVSAKAPVAAARPTTYRTDHKCYPNKPRAVDWLLGSLRINFTDYVEDRGDLVDKTTDHPVIVGQVNVHPSDLPNGWLRHVPPHFVPRTTWHG